CQAGRPRQRMGVARLVARSLHRDVTSKIAEIEARVGCVGFASAFLPPCVEHEGEVCAVDDAIAVDVGATGEAVTAGRGGTLDPSGVEADASLGVAAVRAVVRET
ncbi:MAG: hypothetical protein ACK559_36240, partial [bacterium]